MTRGRRFPWYGWAGASALALGEAGLVLGTHVIEVHFYLIAWWAYILLVDAAVWKFSGNSLLRDRRWELVVLAFWSIAIWNLFELFNFWLQNWLYVNAPRQLVHGALMSIGAYATVLPAIFETYELVQALRVLEGASVRPWRVGPALRWAWMGAGVAMVAAALLLPRVGFPLIWGFAVFLIDPVCHRIGARSLLGDLERGDPRPLLRLPLAGLVCGVLWEFWNFWAHTKWIYTVPYFEEAKWFEMPPLGFLGFPPFALECYVLVNLLNAARRGRGWEEGCVGAGAPRRLAATAMALALLFDVVVFAGIDTLTVKSYSPELSRVAAISPDVRDRLARVGLSRPDALLERTRTPERLAEFARETGLGVADLRVAREAARLVDTQGLGAEHANTLRVLGIASVADLATQDPVSLERRWREASIRPPTPAQVRVWVGAARRAVAQAP